MLLSHASQDSYDDCISVFRKHPSLILYPACAAGVCLVISAAILFPANAIEHVRGVRFGEEFHIPAESGLIFFGLYFANLFVVAFFNAALCAAALKMLRGKDVTFMDGIRVAIKRLPAIVQWALISGTVGLLMRGVFRVGSFFDSPELRRVAMMASVGVSLFGGLAWAIATLFVIQAIVVEDVGPIDAVKHSAKTFKDRWGDASMGFIGFGILMFVLGIPGTIVVCIAPFIGGVAGSIVLFLGVAWLVITGLMHTAVREIWYTALYLYARTGKTPAFFRKKRMRTAFRSEPAY